MAPVPHHYFERPFSHWASNANLHRRNARSRTVARLPQKHKRTTRLESNIGSKLMAKFRYVGRAYRQALNEDAPWLVSFVAAASELTQWAGVPRRSEQNRSGF